MTQTKNEEENKNYLARNVYERLCDHRYYTGASKYRFDELGNGRGRAGRDNLYLSTGWAPTASRPTEVYSSIIKIPRSPVVEPGTLGTQLFGVQTITPKLIWIYRNGDELDTGNALYLKSYYKNLIQIYSKISKDFRLYGGYCRKLYDQNLNQVLHITQLVDGAKYLATSGEPPAHKNKLKEFLSPFVRQ